VHEVGDLREDLVVFGRRRPALALQGVIDSLHADQAVLEHERVDAVVGTRPGGLGSPGQQKHVVPEDLALRGKACVGQIGEELREGFPDAILTPLRASGRDHYRVISEVGDDLINVRGA
jgi:hypothetical protein